MEVARRLYAMTPVDEADQAQGLEASRCCPLPGTQRSSPSYQRARSVRWSCETPGPESRLWTNLRKAGNLFLQGSNRSKPLSSRILSRFEDERTRPFEIQTGLKPETLFSIWAPKSPV
jgi:hypothetical protein